MDSAAHQTIRRALLRILSPAGENDASSAAVADAAVRAWTHSATELSPLIGREGARALYSRCMALARATYPWLPAAASSVSQAKMLAEFRESLEARGSGEALEAGIAFLVLVAELLGSLIGEALTTRLLSSAWGKDFPDAMTQELPQ